VDSGRFRVISHSIEQDRLANTAKANHQHTLGRTLQPRTFQGNPDRLA
jgi:hypothetical protein